MYKQIVRSDRNEKDICGGFGNQYGGCLGRRLPGRAGIIRRQNSPADSGGNRDLQSQLQAEKKKKDDDIKNLNTQFQAEIKKKDDEIKKLSEQLKKAQAPLLAEIAKKVTR